LIDWASKRGREHERKRERERESKRCGVKVRRCVWEVSFFKRKLSFLLAIRLTKRKL